MHRYRYCAICKPLYASFVSGKSMWRLNELWLEPITCSSKPCIPNTMNMASACLPSPVISSADRYVLGVTLQPECLGTRHRCPDKGACPIRLQCHV
ncbi:hypothetical protein T265_12373 [Opisthorchis viverrini]|uniref:Uncharacterized protein n=1 Tax=Opisthorchis viverrini TaxID=6198 RepID=A0A074Z494_OPIVI|nr:hypothetical protein T265_12373 [Opisthorchis viverrini]KER18110.1 hypothetical protein T265_12373 [Opisthorchis viverrini]